MMSAFFLIEITTISDAEKFALYIEETAPLIKKYGGEYIFKSKHLIPVSGEWDTKKIILMQFENKDMLKNFYQSEEYKKIASLRKESTESKAVIVMD